MRAFSFLGILVITGVASLTGAAETAQSSRDIRLVLQLTVDQLRGDVLDRYRDRLGSGGFARLEKNGVVFTQASYDATNTITAPGHTMLSTGASTAQHGIVANDWWDRASGKVMYCTSDGSVTLVGMSGPGQSPKNLLAETLGDRVVETGGRAFAVAGKDRSSIIPGGRRGRAYWWGDKTGGFITSTYYTTQLPEWVTAWNETKPALKFRETGWKPLREPSSYRFASAAGNPYARPEPTLGRSFPHGLAAQSDAVFYAAFRFTPFLDVVTADFATELIAREKLGQQARPDYLSISFSGNDYIGHAYGPNTMEAEDSLLRLDETLARLFAAVDQNVGWSHTLIVLCADHGVDDIPEARLSRGEPAGRIRPTDFMTKGNEALRQSFPGAGNLIAAFVPPSFYLDAKAMEAARADPAAVAEALVTFLRKQAGVARAFTRAQLESTGPLPDELAEKSRRAYFAGRSGDVVMVQAEHWYLYPDADAYAAMHGSPYAYDSFVPMLWSIPGEPARKIDTPVSPAQIAPTLAALLSVSPPSGARQPVLPLGN